MGPLQRRTVLIPNINASDQRLYGYPKLKLTAVVTAGCDGAVLAGSNLHQQGNCGGLHRLRLVNRFLI